MIKLVIFDMDGTLLNTLDDLANSTNQTLHRFGFPEHPIDAYRYFVGDGIRKLVERALPSDKRDEETIELIYNAFMPYYDKHKEEKTGPYPGIISLLKQLVEHGILLAVASNKIEELMPSLMEHFFPSIPFAAVKGSLPGRATKPDPAIVEDILKETGVEKEETLYVGDTAVDMKTATAAGLFKIGVLWGFRTFEELQQAGADAIISDPSEILGFIEL